MDGTNQNNVNLPLVLLVENDKPSIDVTKYFLKGAYSVDYAVNGVTALKMAVDKKYSLILMDINLGEGLIGIDVAKEIKNIHGYENTAIVALTAYAGQNEKENFLSLGLTHYLAKPFNKAALIRLIKSILEPEN